MASETPFKPAFMAIAAPAKGSSSAAVTRAPARAAAIATSPHQAPISSALFPATDSGWSRMWRASAWPPAQAKAQ